MLRRSKNRDESARRLVPRPAVPPIGITGTPDTPLTGAVFEPVLGNAALAGPTTGAAAAQLRGTDNVPIDDAPPIFADNAPPLPAPRPDSPAEPNVAPADPVGTLELAAVPITLPLFEAPAAPFTKLKVDIVVLKCPLRSFSADRNPDADKREDAPDVDEGDASACSAWGTAEISRELVNIASWVCAPADVLAAWVTAMPCLIRPAAVVVAGGGVNGVTFAAAAEASA